MFRDDACVLDMLCAARKVAEFARGVDEAGFLKNEILQSAVMHQIQIIGEAARKVSQDYREGHPEVPWRDIVGMRHRLVHEYFQIVPERVWEVVEHHIEVLIGQLSPLVPSQDDFE